VIFRFEITMLSYIENAMFDHVTWYLNRGNEWVDIGYNINYMKILEWSRDDSSS